MEIARTEGNYQLNIGSLAAKGLYNITDEANDISLEATARMRVSDWLDEETKEELLSLSKEEFITECENILNL